MLSKKVTEALNKQIELEAAASHLYLSMASWAEGEGLNGVSTFLYMHAEEERMHMLKLVKFVNERGSHAIIPEMKQPPRTFKSVKSVFDQVLSHEIKVTNDINKVVEITLKERDYTTQNFLQWFVSEQIEEEALARKVVDKLKLIGGDSGGIYFFDRDMETLAAETAAADAAKGE